jgi:predicted GNAT superfamily acetyltransferase
MLEIRPIGTAGEAEAMAAFLQSIWADGPEVVPADLIIAGVHVNAYAAAAFDGHKIVGASFGIQGSYQDQNILHSHVTAAIVAGAGFELKQHQKHWAIDQGLAAITWTFDPLVRRNCYFNFGKLGAKAIEYLPNFYGSMTDSINAGEESDRLFAWWSLAERDSNAGAEVAQVELPEDIETLRKTNIQEATAWRHRVRAELAAYFAQGATISAMTADRKALIISK